MTVISQSDDREAIVGEAVVVAATYEAGPDKGVVYFKTFTPEGPGRHILNLLPDGNGGIRLEVETPKDDEARIIIDVYPSGIEALVK